MLCSDYCYYFDRCWCLGLGLQVLFASLFGCLVMVMSFHYRLFLVVIVFVGFELLLVPCFVLGLLVFAL